MKKVSWIIVANSSRARIFKTSKESSLEEIETLVHPASRLKAHELVESSQGRSFDSFGEGRHKMEPKSDPKKVECELFAKTIVERLEEGRNQKAYDRFYLASSPSMLGYIRQEMSGSIMNLLAGEVDKDITNMSLTEIREHFPYIL
ncbi:MAG: host attachment protein [Chlamydiales bacterium]